MRIGLTVADFTWPEGAGALGSTLGKIATTAESAGFTSISVMDHFFQIRLNGPSEHEMLEAYTTLGFLAGHTSTVRLGTPVTGVHYRHPGLLAKIVTTLDVLSGGRAWLGIGAGWNEEESRGLGVPFPATGVRFEQLEEALRICAQMWAGEEAPFDGRHFHLERPLNSPQPLRQPHPPIMVGGGGEKKTLRLVARYADACNLFAVSHEAVAAKLAVLRAHCEAEQRDYDAIEKTIAYQFDLGPNGERVQQAIDDLTGYREIGIQTVHAAVTPPYDLAALELIGERVIPAVRDA